jgi:hypothetical protein
MRIRITTPSSGEVFADLSDENPKTVRALWDALPIEARANTWGDEIYFSIPVEAEAENPKEVVEMGDLGYWPPGSAFCIFFGPTPVSRGDEIRPASPVNVIGRIDGDPLVFRKVRGGEEVVIERA